MRHAVRASVSMLVVFFAAGLCSAASAPPQNLQDFFGIANTPATIGKLKADVTTITCTEVDSKVGVACSDGSYAAQCVSGVCGCIHYSQCTNTGGTAGKGLGVLELGFDLGNGATLGLTPDCYPLFGVYTNTGKTDTKGEITNVDAIACDPLSGEVAAVLGGWQLVSWNTDKVADGAGGSFTGTMNVTTGALKLVLKGKTF